MYMTNKPAPKKTRPSRKGIHITPYKGGRTSRRLAVMTPQTAAKLDAILEKRGESFGDWIERKVREDEEYMFRVGGN